MNSVIANEKPTLGGLAGFVVAMIRRGRGGFGEARASKRLQLLETLQLGGKRQLLLVSCEGQNFLVGAGAEGVQTIVAVAAAEVRL